MCECIRTEPRDLIQLSVKQRLGRCAGVVWQRLVVWRDCLAQNQHVWQATEGIREESDRLQKHFAVVTRGLASARTIIVPDGELLRGAASHIEC
jgi:hypothetical protein